MNIDTAETKLKIETFGEFALISNGKRITEQAKKSSKVWRLIQYLVVNRYKVISQDELLELFCDDDLQVNPGSVLRTLVYRARNTLKKSGLECADNLIIAKSGGYSWNNDIECITDIEEFEGFIKQASAETADKTKQLELLMQAIDLYKGDFLPTTTGDLWVMPLVRWYRTLYIDTVHKALILLNEDKNNTEAEKLCTKALSIDPFDEKLIEHFLRALIRQEKFDEALDFYKKMEVMFFDILGINFSDDLRSLYNMITHPGTGSEMTLDMLIDEWHTDAFYPGAYYCDASLFKILYHIEVRSLPRSGRSAYIVRFDTKHDPKAKDGGIMKKLGQIIPGCLRMGDLFTRSSPNQYMMMLYSLTYEDCQMLIHRILSMLDSKHLPNLLNTEVKYISPMGQEG